MFSYFIIIIIILFPLSPSFYKIVKKNYLKNITNKKIKKAEFIEQ